MRRPLEEGRQVLLHDLVQDRLLRPPAPVLRDLHDETTANGVPHGKRRNPRGIEGTAIRRVTIRNMG